MWPKIGPIPLYGIFYFLGIGVHFVIGRHYARQFGLKRRVWIVLGLCYFVGMIPGAKFLYYWKTIGFDPLIVFHGRAYLQGGLWGGLLVYFPLAAIAMWLLTQKRKHALDLIALTVPIPWALGKIGCLMNGCCYGRPTSLPWAITFPATSRGAPPGVPLHPTQLYEVLIMVALVVLFRQLNHDRWRGTMLLWFLTVYGFGRTFIDAFRGDTKEYAVQVGAVTLTHLLCLAVAVVALLILLVYWNVLKEPETNCRSFLMSKRMSPAAIADSKYLFVYGTLRGESSHDMAGLLKQYAQWVGRATYQGRLYRIDWYPGVVPSEEPQDQVHGDLYQIEDPKTLFTQLDLYEESGPSFPQPTEYIRTIQKIRCQDRRILDAWIYLYNRPTEDLQWIQSGDFLSDG